MIGCRSLSVVARGDYSVLCVMSFVVDEYD